MRISDWSSDVCSSDLGVLLFMASLFALRAHPEHPVVQNEAEQKNDEEIDQRESSRRPKIELPDGLLGQVLAQTGGGITGPAARQHKRFGVAHEAVHDAQPPVQNEPTHNIRPTY